MAPCDDRDPTSEASGLKAITQADSCSSTDTSGQELLTPDQVDMGLNFLRVRNGHQMLFIPLTIPCPPLLQAGQQRLCSLLQKTHINILFEFLTSRHNSYLTS